MNNTPVELNIAIVDADKASAGVLKAILETNQDVKVVRIFNDLKTAQNSLHHHNFNGMFIDIFSFGSDKGLDFIEYVREQFPIISICLYSKLDSCDLRFT